MRRRPLRVSRMAPRGDLVVPVERERALGREVLQERETLRA